MTLPTVRNRIMEELMLQFRDWQGRGYAYAWDQVRREPVREEDHHHAYEVALVDVGEQYRHRTGCTEATLRVEVEAWLRTAADNPIKEADNVLGELVRYFLGNHHLTETSTGKVLTISSYPAESVVDQSLTQRTVAFVSLGVDITYRFSQTDPGVLI